MPATAARSICGRIYGRANRGLGRGGREEGTHDRPCAAVIAIMDQNGESEVLVPPVMHIPPLDPADAAEIHRRCKALL